MGTRGARARAGRAQADPAQHRLRGVSLVPRHGARVVRGRGDRRADERALRLHQGRPRGAARPRRDLHAGDAGDDGARRLADDGVPHARRASRSTPARTSRPTIGTGCRASAACSPRVADAWRNRQEQRGAHRGVDARAVRGEHGAHAQRRARSTKQLLDACRRRAAHAVRAAVRRLRRRAEVPADDDARLRCCGAGRARRSPRRCDMVTHTFRRMARGGIYDQVGGGFARYTVDAYWLVPHFEKMLYDNALLVRLGAALWQATRDEEVRRVTEETLGWLTREMTSPEGGFYSSLDADSEGHEGRYYVWDSSELESLLGEDASLLRAYWGVTPDGNFEGRNILFVPHDPDGRGARAGGDGAGAAHRGRARAAHPVRGARAARASGPRRQDPGELERPDAARRGRSGARVRRRGASRAGRAQRRVPLPRDGARRPRAAQLQGGRGEDRRLPRGPRRRRAGRAGRVRADVRPDVARARAPAGRRDPRAVLGRRRAARCSTRRPTRSRSSRGRAT